MNKKNNIIIYNTPDGKASVSLYTKDGMVWMNQNQIAELFDTSKQNIGQHVSKILLEGELKEEAVVNNYFTTASDGKQYNVTFYSLEMVLSIGFRVRSRRGIQFRQWANRNLKEYLVKGFLMDDERLKNPDNRPDYFDELLQRIRDIRASEKRFYQKIRDLFSLSSDYDKTDKATQMFFAEIQNKLLFAVTGKTAAEIIISRADDMKPNMNLTAWKGNVVRKQDIYVAKNYLTKDEIDTLNRLVIVFLESAELRAKNRRENVDKILEFHDKNILTSSGSITNTEMKKQVKLIYEQFDQRRKITDANNADEVDLEELEAIEYLVQGS